MPRLAACAILYHPENDTYENIASYIDNVERLIIVDNSIKKNHALLKRLQTEFKEKLTYIDNGGNLGIATALNRACNEAIHLQFEWILTMDQDSAFVNFAEYKTHLNNLASQKDLAILAVNFSATSYDPPPLSALQYIDINSSITSGNIINLKHFQSVGGFKEELFIDMVDFEYCLRVRLHGLRILHFPYIYLKHQLGTIYTRKNLFTRKERKKCEHNAQRVYYITRNSFYVAKMYRKHFPAEIGLLRMLNVYFIHEITKILIYEADKWNKLKAKFIGLCHFLIGRYGKYDL